MMSRNRSPPSEITVFAFPSTAAFCLSPLDFKLFPCTSRLEEGVGTTINHSVSRLAWGPETVEAGLRITNQIYGNDFPGRIPPTWVAANTTSSLRLAASNLMVGFLWSRGAWLVAFKLPPTWVVANITISLRLAASKLMEYEHILGTVVQTTGTLSA